MTKQDNPASTEMRIAKAIARSGLCSRRDAEKWIFQGRVSINGKRLDTPACIVTEKDNIMVDGKPLPATQDIRLWRYNKPKGLVTTHKDPEGRPTVFQSLEESMPRVISVGRLDINTEGLLLLTTDGQLARALELPSTGWTRKYRVRANGKVTEEQLLRLKDGITVDGVKYGSIDASLERVQGTNCWLNLGLKEGKNREVKNVLGALGLKVNRLIRISYGPFLLGDMKPGEIIEVKRKTLAEQLGFKIAKEVGLKKPVDNKSGGGKARSKPAGSGGRKPPMGRKNQNKTNNRQRNK